MLDGLDPQQLEVALAPVGPVCVLAGAGTGKTRAITHRLAYQALSGVIDPRAALALTFTTRAAGELRARLRGLGVPAVTARTFHAAALRQVQYFWPRVLGGRPPRLVEGKLGLVGEAGARVGVRVDRTGLRDLAGEIEWAKATLVAPDRYPRAAARAGRTGPGGLDLEAVAAVLTAYEQVKGERAVMDFEDVLLYDVALLADHPSVARTVRDQYRHVVVDEYQDVSPLQQELLERWTRPQTGADSSLCVVGDPDQTIYSFAGATSTYLTDFPARHPGSTVVRLVRDYRSTPQVVAAASALLGGPTRLVAVRPDGPAARVEAYPDDPAEARGVADAVGRLLAAGLPAREVAVLFRTNGASAVLEEAFDEAGIPVVLRGVERFFDRPEVRTALAALRAAARRDAGTPGPRRPGTPGGGLREVVRQTLSPVGWVPSAPPGGVAVRERWESLQALVALADTLAGADPHADLSTLVAELDQRVATAHAPLADGVTLSSLHAAKGLEWEAVFLVGLAEGVLPISYARTAPAVAEERRLLYVGATRARTHLGLSWARARVPGGAGRRRPSRFLQPLLAPHQAPAGDGARPPAGPAGRARRARRPAGPVRCRVCGRELSTAGERKVGRCGGCPSTADEAVVAALRRWRSQRAQDDAVPAYVVFTDATLTAIAEARPRTLDELAALPGVGPVKLDRYGGSVLGILADPGSAPASSSTG